MTTSTPNVPSSLEQSLPAAIERRWRWRRRFALAAKDWRAYRLPTLALVLVTILVYGSVAVLTWNAARSSTQPIVEGLLGVLQSVSLFVIALSALVAAAFGGVALAGERTERTAIFMAMLPVTRLQIVASKLLVAAAIIGCAVAFHLAVASAALVGQSWMMGVDISRLAQTTNFVRPLPMLLSFMLACFSLAWCFGSFSRSAAISACVSIAISLGVPMFVTLYLESQPAVRGAPIPWWVSHTELLFAAIDGALGLFGLMVGTVIALRRVEP
jgi:ABC-type transport system involved in multi-copper enzyme maturation permease subunit